MLREILIQACESLRRQPIRSFLTMLGIVWGIVAVTLLVAYGSSFRNILLGSFQAFGNDVVIGWPATTSEQTGGERAGKKLLLEQADEDLIRARATLVKHVCRETVRWLPISFGDRMANTAIRGVCPAYGEMRNEVPNEGRWIDPEDFCGAAARSVSRLGVATEVVQRPACRGANREDQRPALHGDWLDEPQDAGQQLLYQR